MNLRTALVWTLSGHAFQSLIRFFGSIAIARILLPEQVGVFALAMSVGALLDAVREVGASPFLVQKENLQTHHVQSAYGVLLIGAIVAAGLCLVSRSWIAAAYQEPRMETVLGLVAVSFLFWPIVEPARAILSRDMRFDVLQKAAVVGSTTGTLTSITLAYAGFGPTALAVGLLVRSATQATVILTGQRDHLRLRPSFRDAREIISFGGLLSAASICGRGATEGRKIVLGAGLGLDAVAWLDRAVSLPATFQGVIFAPLNDVLLPKYSQLARERRDISAPYLKVVTCGVVIAWPAYIVLALVATPVAVLLFGENWRSVGNLLTFILVARALFVVVPSLEQVLIAHGRTPRLLAFRFVMLAASVPAYIYAVQYGLTGFGVAVVALAVLRLGLSFLCLRFVGIDSRQLALAVLPALPVATLSSLPMLLGLLFVEGEPGALGVIAGVACCGAAWLIAAYLFRSTLPGEIETVRLSLLAQLRRVLPQ